MVVRVDVLEGAQSNPTVGTMMKSTFSTVKMDQWCLNSPDCETGGLTGLWRLDVLADTNTLWWSCGKHQRMGASSVPSWASFPRRPSLKRQIPASIWRSFVYSLVLYSNIVCLSPWLLELGMSSSTFIAITLWYFLNDEKSLENQGQHLDLII